MMHWLGFFTRSHHQQTCPAEKIGPISAREEVATMSVFVLRTSGCQEDLQFGSSYVSDTKAFMLIMHMSSSS